MQTNEVEIGSLREYSRSFHRLTTYGCTSFQHFNLQTFHFESYTLRSTLYNVTLMAKAAKATKGSSKANTDPKSQNRGPGESGDIQNQDSAGNKGAAYPSELQPVNDETEPPRRGRGRRKKTVTDGISGADVVKEPAPTKAPPRKRGRNDVTPAGASDDQPVSKRAKGDYTDNSQLPAQRTKATGTRKPAEVTTRDPLPDRKGRNVHPAPTKPTRRTSQEVEAEREAKRKAVEQKIQELEEAKCRLAEMNVSEDIQDDAIDQNYPQRLSVAIRKRQHAEIEEDSDNQELFDFRDVDEMSSQSESEEQPVQETAVSAIIY